MLSKMNNYIVGTMEYSLKPKGAITIAFTTSRYKGYRHYRKVRNQALANWKLSKYGQSLLESCFKNW